MPKCPQKISITKGTRFAWVPKNQEMESNLIKLTYSCKTAVRELFAEAEVKRG